MGDLCFVAIGQIANRGFAAVRYQPTGGLVVSSPSASPALRRAVAAEWGGLDTDGHSRLAGNRTPIDYGQPSPTADGVNPLLYEDLASRGVLGNSAA